MKRVRVIRETTGVVELQKLINPRVSNMASEDILINNQLQMGDVPLPRLITRGYCSMKRIVYIVIYNYMYIYIHIYIHIQESQYSGQEYQYTYTDRCMR